MAKVTTKSKEAGLEAKMTITSQMEQQKRYLEERKQRKELCFRSLYSTTGSLQLEGTPRTGIEIEQGKGTGNCIDRQLYHPLLGRRTYRYHCP